MPPRFASGKPLLPTLGGAIMCGVLAALAAPSTGLADELAVLETAQGSITIKLLRDKAPRHVDNFEKLAQSGFYDGTTFHRVIPGYIVQGGSAASKDGDPKNDNFGHLDYTLKPEFSDVAHDRGVVSMARNPDVLDSAGSQFFIELGRAPTLDQIKFTVFGRVIEGMDVVDKIASAPRDVDNYDRPLEPVVVRHVRISGLAAPAAATPLPSASPSPVVVAGRASPPAVAGAGGAAGAAGVRPTPVTIPLGAAASTPPGALSAASRVRTISDNVNIREGPSAEKAVLQRVRRGTILTTSGRDGDWFKVVLATGKPGYVRKDMIEPAP